MTAPDPPPQDAPADHAPKGDIYVQTRSRDGRVIRHPLGPGGLRIGSAEDLGLNLVLEGLARNHARVSWRGGAVEVTDLGGDGGTKIQGADLVPFEPTTWELEQTLELGKPRHHMRLIRVAPQARASPETTAEARPEALGPASGAEPLAVEVVPQSLIITPGAACPLTILLTNGGSTALSCDLELETASPAMFTCTFRDPQPPIELQPMAKPHVVTCIVHVERRPASNARQYPVRLALRVRDRAGGPAGELRLERKLLWTVTAYEEAPTLTPRRESLAFQREREKTGRAILRNPTNAMTFYRVTAKLVEPLLEGDTGASVECRQSLLAVEPGGERTVYVTVQAADDVREETPRTVLVRAQQTGTDLVGECELPFVQQPPPQDSRLEQLRRGVAQNWALLLIGLLALAGVVVLALALNYRPDLQARQAAETQQAAAVAESVEARVSRLVAQTQVARIGVDAFRTQTAQSIRTAIIATAVQSTSLQLQTVNAVQTEVQATQIRIVEPLIEAATGAALLQAGRAAEASVAQTVAAREQAIFQTADAEQGAFAAAVGATATQVANQTATVFAASTVLAQAETQQALVGQTATAQAEPVYFTIGPVRPCVAVGESLGNVVVTVFDVLNRHAVGISDPISVQLEPLDRSRGQLQGTTEQTPKDGIGRFTDLSITRPGLYRLLGRYRRFEPQPSEAIRVVEGDAPCAPELRAGAAGSQAAPTPTPAPGEPPELTPILSGPPVEATPIYPPPGEPSGAAPATPGARL